MINKNEPMTEAMYYVLLALIEPSHGYQIMLSINKLSNGRILMGPGTLYGILSRLEKKKLIILIKEENRKKIYVITSLGKELLTNEYNRLKIMVNDGEIIIKECM